MSLHDPYFPQMIETNLSHSLCKKSSCLPQIIASFWSNYTRIGNVTFFVCVWSNSIYFSHSLLPPYTSLPPLSFPSFPLFSLPSLLFFPFSFPFPSIHCTPTMFCTLLDTGEEKTRMSPFEGSHWPVETNINQITTRINIKLQGWQSYINDRFLGYKSI